MTTIPSIRGTVTGILGYDDPDVSQAIAALEEREATLISSLVAEAESRFGEGEGAQEVVDAVLAPDLRERVERGTSMLVAALATFSDALEAFGSALDDEIERLS